LISILGICEGKLYIVFLAESFPHNKNNIFFCIQRHHKQRASCLKIDINIAVHSDATARSEPESSVREAGAATTVPGSEYAHTYVHRCPSTGQVIVILRISFWKHHFYGHLIGSHLQIFNVSPPQKKRQ
jgi:hypothetical protein